MVRIQPQNAISWGFLGDAEIARNNLDEAREHFTQAVHLAPTYEYSSNMLLDILVHQERWDDAKEMLDFVAPHLSPEWVVSEQGRIAALSGDKELAFEKLRQICEIPSENHSAIDAVVASIFTAGWKQETLDFLTKQVQKPDALPGAAYVFVHLSTSMEKWDFCEQTVKSLRNRRELWESGADKYMVEACTSKEGAEQDRMKRFMAEDHSKLTGSTKMWQRTGSALCMGGLDKDVCKFMSDWKSRPDTTAEGLFPLACSLWGEKKEQESYAVSNAALKKGPDWSTGSHMVLMGLYQLIQAVPEAAFELIRDVDPLNLTSHFQCRYEAIVTTLQSIGNQEPHGDLQNKIEIHYKGYIEHLKDVTLHREHNLIQQGIARIHCKKLAGFAWKYFKKK